MCSLLALNNYITSTLVFIHSIAAELEEKYKVFWDHPEVREFRYGSTTLSFGLDMYYTSASSSGSSSGSSSDSSSNNIVDVVFRDIMPKRPEMIDCPPIIKLDITNPSVLLNISRVYKKRGVVYLFVNNLNGKMYTGSTINLLRSLDRIGAYIRPGPCVRGALKGSVICRAINKHKIVNFSLLPTYVLESFIPADYPLVKMEYLEKDGSIVIRHVKYLLIREAMFMHIVRPTYNVNPVLGIGEAFVWLCEPRSSLCTPLRRTQTSSLCRTTCSIRNSLL